MIKLERIYVKNYKNIAEAELNLGQVNVVVGENNAGKTNLLEVIPFLNYIINGPPDDIERQFESGGFFENFGILIPLNKFDYTPIRPLIIELDFSDSEKNIFYTYKIIFENGEMPINGVFPSIIITQESLALKERNTTGKAVTIFKRLKKNVEYGKGVRKDDIISEVEEHVSVIRLLGIIYRSGYIVREYQTAISSLREVLSSDIFYFSPQLLKEASVNYENKNRIVRADITSDSNLLLQNNLEWKNYLSTLKSVLNIDDVKFTGGGKRIDKQIPEKVKVYFFQNQMAKFVEDLSDGSVVLLALITKLYSDSSDIFLIEEPENSIHPRALSELMKLIRHKSLDKQFIITTHSPYLLNMIKPEEVFVASINEGGTSTITALPDVKAIKKKLAKGFMDFGDIVFDEAAIEK